MSSKFIHHKLELVIPEFDSSITNLIIDLDHLRKKELRGTTHPKIFFQLKSIFHMLESIGSARIEGNNTTITDFIENQDDDSSNVNEDILEIRNIESSMSFIDDNIEHIEINRAFVSELHKHIVKGLSREGDKTPGQYRSHNISIANSKHKPPEPFDVPPLMDKLFQFINKSDESKYDLLKTALAHHRFVWVHPFGNGNGRTVRLFTYAMLVKQGFNVNLGRIVNPTAVFCNDRDLYYKYLSIADQGTKAGLLEWCEYVLSGLKNEIEKIDNLSNYDYLSKNILIPALNYCSENNYFSKIETSVLRIAINKQVFQSTDIKHLFPGKVSAEVSRQIRNLRDNNLISPEKVNARSYLISFKNKMFYRGIVRALDKKGFLPIANE